MLGITFWFTTVFAVLGWEIGTFFIALNNDDSQIAAFSSMINSAAFIWDINFGFQVYVRTRVNHLLGVRKFDAAKRLGLKVIGGESLLAAMLGLLFFVLRHQIASIYASDHPRQYDYMISLISLYAFFILADMNIVTIFVICRSINHAVFLNIIMVLFVAGGGLASNCVLHFAFEADCVVIYVSNYVCMIIALAICIVKLASFNWKKVVLLSK